MLLANHGAQLDKANNEGFTPAHGACHKGYIECLSLLINHGVDCSKTNYGAKARGPIHFACEMGHYECVKALLERGKKVDVNYKTRGGMTPAFLCCLAGHVKILHLLIQHGADFSLADTFGVFPAIVASMYGRVKMLALIKRVNADLINQRDYQGRTPLFYARQYSQNGAVEWLIEHGAEEAGKAWESTDFNLTKVQLIKMLSIISLTRPFISHISSSLYTAG